MTSIWVESLGRNFEAALDLLAAAVRDCTDERWEASMWAVPTDLFGVAHPALTGSPSLTPPPAWIITGAVGHTIEHGAQIRQFITAAGVTSAA